MLEYNKYEFSKKEKIKYISLTYLTIFFITYLFYEGIIISLIAGLLAIYYLKIINQQIIDKRKRTLLLQFKDSIYLLATSISAGYSVENSFKKTLEELKTLYQGQDTFIIKEFENIVQGLSVNKDIDNILLNFSSRANIVDITNFVEVFITCKATGGNLNEVIRNTSTLISEKIDIEEEISILIAQKKLEQKIICIIPIAIMLMLRLTARDYIAPLFDTFAGNIIVTIALALIIGAIALGIKIMDIEV